MSLHTGRLINRLFLQRLLLVALGIGGIQLLLRLFFLHTFPWLGAFDAFLVGMLVVHKLSVRLSDIAMTAKSPMGNFFKTFFVYALPASVIWAVLIIEIFKNYLPGIGYPASPLWAALCGTAGCLALCKALLQGELTRLVQPRI